MLGLKNAAEEAGHSLLVEGPGPMFAISFSQLARSRDYRDTLSANKAKLGQFISAMHEEGIRIIGRGLWYISAAHTDEDIDHAVATARKVLAEIRS